MKLEGVQVHCALMQTWLGVVKGIELHSYSPKTIALAHCRPHSELCSNSNSNCPPPGKKTVRTRVQTVRTRVRTRTRSPPQNRTELELELPPPKKIIRELFEFELDLVTPLETELNTNSNCPPEKNYPRVIRVRTVSPYTYISIKIRWT